MRQTTGQKRRQATARANELDEEERYHRQLIYETTVDTLHCRVEEVRAVLTTIVEALSELDTYVSGTCRWPTATSSRDVPASHATRRTSITGISSHYSRGPACRGCGSSTCGTAAGPSLADAGVDPKVIQQRFGHAKIATTYDNYIHAHPEGPARATEVLNRALSGGAS